eukprot:TRINITY_DN1869_c0_g1_i1.p1 TRINITY_DN1869_c0_g1~~TRINITY_DN1869_c0_g1_i1.p1  ORF type:complete len:439 (-),score=38.00 TRINITY_DN1869_c0_g1_i1:176-1408(-)
MTDVDNMRQPLSERLPSASLEAMCQRKRETERETRSLLRSGGGVLRCYSMMEPHCVFDQSFGSQHIVEYDVQKLTTVRVFFVLSGTVLTDPILWFEMFLNSAVFAMVLLLSMYFRLDDLNHFVGEESDIRAFISMLTMLVCLILAFYTSLNISRWWDVRMVGVKAIWHASSKLTLQVSQGVTRDPELLDAIWRYACASLAFVFMMRSGVPDQMDNMIKWGLLTGDESQLMSLIPSSQRSEAIWSWLGGLVSRLYQHGLVPSHLYYSVLLTTIDDGRVGANALKTYLETPIPMHYVHLVGLGVKLHNILVAILMAFVCAVHAMKADYMGCFRPMSRAFLMPFLFNAILLITSDLTDPFSGDLVDFCLGRLVREIRDDAKAIVSCGAVGNLPPWLDQAKKFKKWNSAEESTV